VVKEGLKPGVKSDGCVHVYVSAWVQASSPRLVVDI